MIKKFWDSILFVMLLLIVVYGLLNIFVFNILAFYHVPFEAMIFDVQINFDPTVVYQNMDFYPLVIYKKYYIIAAFLDSISAVLYARLGYLALIKVIHNQLNERTKKKLASMTFVLAMFADLLENAGYSIIFSLYPKEYIWAIKLIKMLTLIKFICLFIGIIGVIYFLIRPKFMQENHKVE